MKKAFTLVELMVVTVVLVTLMTIMFRLAGIGGDSAAANTTADRMHRLENALSGYYAAFGTYPPVKLHASRNPFIQTDDYGNQDQDGGEKTSIWGWLDSDGKVTNTKDEQAAWGQVKTACRAQPVACEFPFPKNLMKDYIDELSKKKKKETEESKNEREKEIFGRGFDDGISDRIGRFSQYRNISDWGVVQLFRFGLMSFLLPRYLVMMNSEKELLRYAQWEGNNTEPRDPLTGGPMGGWAYMQEQYITKANRTNSDTAHVANIPSQAACARWMASFDRVLFCNYPIVLFGVHIWENDKTDDEETSQGNINMDVTLADIHVPGGFKNGDSSAQYVLDKITMRDGWGNDFYYYSPAPYQSYILWSAGPNGKTFPPWISRENLDGLGPGDKKTIGEWIEDDIVNLSK